MSRPFVRSLLAALMVLVLGASVALAAPRRAEHFTPRSPAPATSTTAQAIARAWGFLRSVWAAEGNSLDPFGNSGHSAQPPGATPSSDAGNSLDPFGGK
jgi:hypothetical protein